MVHAMQRSVSGFLGHEVARQLLQCPEVQGAGDSGEIGREGPEKKLLPALAEMREHTAFSKLLRSQHVVLVF